MKDLTRALLYLVSFIVNMILYFTLQNRTTSPENIMISSLIMALVLEPLFIRKTTTP